MTRTSQRTSCHLGLLHFTKAIRFATIAIASAFITVGTTVVSH
jgi:hypothetical protein